MSAASFSIKKFMTKKQQQMAFVSLEDLSGVTEVVVLAEEYQEFEEIISGSDPLIVTGKIELKDDARKILASNIAPIHKLENTNANLVRIRLSATGLDDQRLRDLKSIVQRHRGNIPVKLHIVIPDESETIIALPSTLNMVASYDAMAEVERDFGENVMSFE